MCGLLGIYGETDISDNHFSNSLMLQSLRGPDNFTVAREKSALLGHVRLSIHDLSDVSNQPMYSSDGRYHLLFNGEIYNFRDLKLELEKIEPSSFVTDSDTEVLLKYLIVFGLEKTLISVRGMFAFSFFDSFTGNLYVARDVFGEKPLYFYESEKSISVSSSLYSLIYLKEKFSINESVVSDFLHYGYSKGEGTAINGIKKLLPSSYLVYSTIDNKIVEESSYADLYLKDVELDSPELPSNLGSLLKKSVERCLDSDVPVGVFLSGGIDSSLIASYVSEIDNSVSAYTIGFDNKDYDESTIAELIADELGISIKVLSLSKQDLIEALNASKKVFDEPFADASYLALYCLSKFARQDVTVCLSGDGGDELFSGYNRHILIPKFYKATNWIPHFLRKIVSCFFKSSPKITSYLALVYTVFFAKNGTPTALNEKIRKLIVAFDYVDYDDLFFKIVAGEDYSEELNLPPPTKHSLNGSGFRELSSLDMKTYLHEDVLLKVDRSTMAASLEARAPLLNVDILNFARSLEDSHHINNEFGQKSELKKLLSKKLPKEIIQRPKSGFSVPYIELVDSVIYDELSNYIQSNGDYSKFFNYDFQILSNKCFEYYAGEHSDYKLVWNIFCLYRWVENVYRLKVT
ncbi:asparagine synthase (glutamine-hydrolyzing) [Vibrio splendidus]